MPAIDFPAAPAVNDEYSFEGRTWRWNGTGWEVKEYPAALLAGTAANPSLYFTGDDNTGLYSPGADQVAISTGGTGRLFVAADGNIGVGTTLIVAPNTGGSLTAAGTLAVRGYLSDHQTSAGVFELNGNKFAMRAYGDTAGTGFITFNTGGGGATTDTERLRITSAGNVGIGTSAPAESLDIDGDGDSYLRWERDGAAGGYGSVTSGGVLRIGPYFAAADRELALFTDNANVSWITTGTAEPLVLGTNKTERLRITSAGNVGIGTSAPGTALDVAGVGRIRTGGKVGSNTYLKLESTDASNTMELSFANSTNASWQIQAVENGISYKPLALNPSGGNVGIGTSAPGNRLHISSSGDVARFDSSTTDAGLLFVDSVGGSRIGTRSANIIFDTSSLERVRLDSSGRLLLGTSTAVGDVFNTSVGVCSLQVAGGNGYSVGIHAKRNDAFSNALIFTKARGTTWEAVSNNDRLGYISFQGADGVEPLEAAFIAAEVDGVVSGGGTNDMPGRLVFSTTADGASVPTERLRIDSAGTTTLTSAASTAPFIAKISTSEVARIDSSGRLLVGTSAARTNFFNSSFGSAQLIEGAGNDNRVLAIVGSAGSGAGGGLILASQKSGTVGGNTILAADGEVGLVSFQGSDGTDFVEAARIYAQVDGTPGANDMPGRLVFSTTADGASSPTERMRIGSTGAITATASLSVDGLTVSNTNGSFVNSILLAKADRDASTLYYFFAGVSSASGSADNEFLLRGDGTGLCDGSWTGGGADYAEYFEWSDGNPDADDRRGISVVLDGDKIREAVAGEDPIGVISGNPSVVGDAAWNKWSGKYLRDEYGTYIQEDYEVEDEDGNTVIQQRRKLNPAYDPDVEYVSREQRPEWDCVGLMGKLRIRKGQITGSRWIKMRDISANVEEWLVR